MKTTYLENLTIAITVIMFGIMAGLFWTYTFNINRAMLVVDGETYATMQSLFNVNVRHTMFFSFFFGGGAFSVLALLANFKHRKTLPFALLAVASVIYIVGIIAFTGVLVLPINYVTEAWNPQNVPADWEMVRAQWNQYNAMRVGTSGSAFVLSVLALVMRASTD